MRSLMLRKEKSIKFVSYVETEVMKLQLRPVFRDSPGAPGQTLQLPIDESQKQLLLT